MTLYKCSKCAVVICPPPKPKKCPVCKHDGGFETGTPWEPVRTVEGLA